MKYLTRYLLLAVVVVLSACSPSKSARSTGEFVDDATLTAKVKTEIARSEGAREATAINVDTYRGVVSLAGFVDNSQQAQAAVESAKQVQGVNEVINNLQVKPRP
ncbi:MAG: BON domain-containing protein [Pseudomonadota bacterium]